MDVMFTIFTPDRATFTSAPPPSVEVRLRHIIVENPETISIELTSKCNLKCGMCPLTAGTTSTSSPSSFISPKLWADILDQIDSQVGRVILTGFGEPMLHPNLVEYIRDLEQRKIRTSLTTNGTFVRADFLSALPNLSNLDHINVSVDSVDSAIYARLRKGKLDKCLRTIGRLASCSGPQTTVSVSAILMKSTLRSLVSAPRILAELGVRTLVLQSLFDQTTYGLDEDFGRASDSEEILEEIRKEAARFNVSLCFELPYRLSLERHDPAEAERRYFSDSRQHGESKACGIAWDTTHIDAAGQIFPCCRAAAVNAEKLGGLESNNIADIWNGQSYNRFRNSFSDPSLLSDLCANCSVVQSGTSPQSDYKAEILPRLKRGKDGAFVVRARNTGRKAWTHDTGPVVGLSHPRDHLSPYAHEEWMLPNRVGAMREAVVEPGKIAHFSIPIDLGDVPGTSEHFQLVVDGVAWLPGTSFSLVTERRVKPFRLTAPRFSVSRDFRRGWSSRGQSKQRPLQP
ncbi:radical SAM protein with 4Fe4S-binding SPASM domain [Amorphus suaedae]